MVNIDYSKYTLLIVDDVPLNILLVTKMLSRLPLRVISAYSGEQALDLIASEKPSMVLLDLMMPVMDGFEVLDRIRNNPDTHTLRVVILSALNSDSDIVRGMQAGANDFVTKPIIMERLINAINKQLEEISA